jgi:hypothetical protein
MNVPDLSRRDFLKLSSAALLGLFLPEFQPRPEPFGTELRRGRVQATSLIVRDAPAFSGARLGSLRRDTLVDIADQVFGGVEGDYNRVWYRLDPQGFVYSGWVQPVQTDLNPLSEAIPSTGQLGTITVPYADSYWDIHTPPAIGPRLYYASNHWVTDLVADPADGSFWYRAIDPSNRSHYYTRPDGVHLFSDQELSPLSPQVPGDQKHIRIFLNRQLLLAYEWDVLVYAARVSTGQADYETPAGQFQTFHKRPTYHMVGGADEAHVFDLPGVPWDTYFTENGAAMHGTYWHSDFGHTHSHGCVNLSPEDARWIFRWTQPSLPAGETLRLTPGLGTRVLIRNY